MESVEYKLIDKVEANSDDKYYVSAYKIYLNLIWLNGEIGTGAGDVAGGADFAPTDTDMSLLAMIEKDLAAATEDYKKLMDQQFPAFNRSLEQQGVTPLTSAMPPAESSAAAGMEQ